MSSPLWPPAQTGIALFLDVDGTLIDLAPAPDDARLRADTLALLQRAFDALDGALALVSGRSVNQVDQLVWPLCLPAAGVHGLERRTAQGQHVMHADGQSLEPVRRSLRDFAGSLPGLIFEDKTLGLAIHYRHVPGAEPQVLQAVMAAAAQLDGAATVQPGDMVIELKAGPLNKGSAVADFMREHPFSGRRPVFVGDDLTDEDALQWAAAHGGFGVAVGSRVSSTYRLQDSRAVAQWIEQLIEASKTVE
ncbi:MAG: trehalose-phosphatase [Steroidobacteraceae bacterium]